LRRRAHTGDRIRLCQRLVHLRSTFFLI
jgi:hypothetical protein